MNLLNLLNDDNINVSLNSSKIILEKKIALYIIILYFYCIIIFLLHYVYNIRIIYTYIRITYYIYMSKELLIDR